MTIAASTALWLCIVIGLLALLIAALWLFVYAIGRVLDAWDAWTVFREVAHRRTDARALTRDHVGARR